MDVKIVNNSKNSLPKYSTIASAGMDLRANIDHPIVLKTLERTIIKTGIFIDLPVGVEAQIRPRSGLAFKKGITVLNSPGLHPTVIINGNLLVFVKFWTSLTPRGAPFPQPVGPACPV